METNEDQERGPTIQGDFADISNMVGFVIIMINHEHVRAVSG